MLDVNTDGKTEALSYRICVKVPQLVSNGLQFTQLHGPFSTSEQHAGRGHSSSLLKQHPFLLIVIAN